EPGFADDGERIVLLEKQLAAGIKADGACRTGVPDVARAADDQLHRLVPGGRAHAAALADLRLEQPIGAAVGLPAVQTLGAQPTAVCDVDRAPTDTDDAAILDSDVETATIRA